MYSICIQCIRYVFWVYPVGIPIFSPSNAKKHSEKNTVFNISQDMYQNIFSYVVMYKLYYECICTFKKFCEIIIVDIKLSIKNMYFKNLL